MQKIKDCASCIDFSINKIIKSSKENEPLWLSKRNYVEEFISKQDNTNIRYPEEYDTILKINIGKKYNGIKVLYWGAERKKNNVPITKYAKEAYGKFLNSGISKVSNNGDLLLKFRCPQVYKAQINKNTLPRTYYKHIHFVLFDKIKKEWGNQIYTKIVVCKHNYTETIKKINSGFYVIINSLPCEYFAKDHIPNSYNLCYKDVNKISKKSLFEWFREIVKLHYPKLNKLLNENKIELYEIPIITYCYNEKCNASQICLESLMEKGFVNVDEYSGGIQDYRINMPIDKIIKI